MTQHVYKYMVDDEKLAKTFSDYENTVRYYRKKRTQLRNATQVFTAQSIAHDQVVFDKIYAEIEDALRECNKDMFLTIVDEVARGAVDVSMAMQYLKEVVLK